MFFLLRFFQFSDSIFADSTFTEIEPFWQNDYQTAINSIREKNYKLSVLILNELSKNPETSPGKEGIYYHLGISYYGLGKFTEAINSFDVVIQKNSGSTFFARSTYWVGKTHKAKKDYDQALKYLTEFIEKFPKDEYSVNGYELIADIYFEKGQEEDEIATYLEAIEKNPNHPRIPFLHIRYGRRLFEKSKFKSSIKVFKDIILNSKMKSYEIADLTSDSEIFIGRNLLGLGEIKNAEKQFTGIYQNYPKDREKSSALYFLGETFLLIKNDKLAFQYWGELRQKFPKTEWAIESYLSESKSYKKQNRVKDAIVVLENYIDKNPSSTRWEDFQIELGFLYKQNGNLQSAINRFENVLQSNNIKQISFALFSLAELEESSLNFSKSIQYYEKILNNYSDSEYVSYALYGIAKIKHKNKDFDACIQTIDSLMEKFPDFVNKEYALLLKGDSLSVTGKHSEALIVYNNLKNSKEREIRFQSEMGIGWVYSDKKMYARAEGIFQKILQKEKSKDKYFSEANHALGLMRFNLKLYSKAKENFKSILYESTTDPNESFKKDALYRLALIEFRTEKFPESLALLKKALISGSTNMGEILYYKGLTEKRMNMLSDSISSFSESIKITKNTQKNFYASSLFQRGMAYLSLGRNEEGVADLKESAELQEGASDDSQFEIGKYYLKTDFKKASSEFEILKEKFPNSPFVLESLYLIADTYRSQNNYDEAEKIYKTIESDFESSKKSDSALLLLADGYFRKEEYKSSREACVKYLKSYSDYDGANDCLFRISDIIEKEESVEKKIEFLKKNKSQFYENRKFEYLIKLSESLISNKSMKEAISLLKLIPDKDKFAYKKHFLLGKILDKEENYNGATPHFQFVDNHNDGELAVKSLLRLGRFDLIKKNYESAVKRYSKVIYQYSSYKEEYAESIFFLIVAYDRLGLKDEAEKYKTKLKLETEKTKFFDMVLPSSDEPIPYWE
ncbi:MAG: tetratricopeptide repeat protein [Leptospiraceae bacterium]|nr:tetratricopeptide repeat protein [Leptospiraceae bacterium]